MKHRIEYAAFASIAWMLQKLPLGAVRRAARCFADAVFFLAPVRKQLTARQLMAAFPELSRREALRTARRSYRNLFTTVFELMWTSRIRDEDASAILQLRDREIFESAFRRGRGVIVMSGHYGKWEWLCILAARLFGLRFTVVVHPLHNPYVDRLVESYRTLFGNRVVPMRAAVRESIRTLREHGVLAMIADQSGPGGGLFLPFLGRPAATYEGPAVFALKTGAAVLLATADRREDGNYTAHIEEIPTSDLNGPSEQNIRELTRRHVEALERRIAANPGDWLWQHRRWKHAPPPDSTDSAITRP